ncbi:hypothetical protein M885DRAFT_532919 [Pelagophyceae sp. CCMP2097]|nr:hypothetical protein M885DRAFT_532919 [Pelagophyceae sp. CCMP2097]|mmetsp:Transcript_12225/g.42328  ORF Transcript_12225/g.42328 Transcript_12225/m.42328 type:complete len:666 (-) Transcript_12225:17-2014(-)
MSAHERAEENAVAGEVFFAGRKWAEAADRFEEASAAFQDFHEPLARSRLEAKLGSCHVEMRDYETALRHFQLQFDYAADHDIQAERTEGMAAGQHNVGSMQYELGRLSDAEACLVKALAMLGKLQLPAQEARSESMLGCIHEQRGLYDDAISCHTRDLEASKRLTRRKSTQNTLVDDALRRSGEDGELRANLNLGLCLYRTGRVADARPHFERVIEVCDELGDGAVSGGRQGARRNANFLAKALYHSVLISAPVASFEAEKRLERAFLCFDELDGFTRRPKPGSAVESCEDAEMRMVQADAWRARSDDAVCAAVVHVALAKHFVQRTSADGSPRPDAALSAWHSRMARSFADIARLKDMSGTDLKIGTAGLAVVDFHVHCADGLARALRGDLSGAAAAFGKAHGATKETKGSFSNSKIYGSEKDGPSDLLLFDQGDSAAQRAKKLNAMQSAAKSNQAACLRKGVGAGALCASGAGAPPTNAQLKKAADAAAAASQLAANDRQVCAALAHRAACRFQLGSPDEASEDFDAHLTTANDVDSPRLKMTALRNLADFNAANGDPETAITNVKAQLQLAEAIKDSVSVADASLRLVQLYTTVAAAHDGGFEGVEVVSLERLEAMHPEERARREESDNWTACNAQALAKLHLKRYRALEHVWLWAPHAPKY